MKIEGKTTSEILISESRAIVCQIRGTHPALATWIERLTREYEIAIKHALALEKTIHRAMK